MTRFSDCAEAGMPIDAELEQKVWRNARSSGSAAGHGAVGSGTNVILTTRAFPIARPQARSQGVSLQAIGKWRSLRNTCIKAVTGDAPARRHTRKIDATGDPQHAGGKAA